MSNELQCTYCCNEGLNGVESLCAALDKNVSKMADSNESCTHCAWKQIFIYTIYSFYFWHSKKCALKFTISDKDFSYCFVTFKTILTFTTLTTRLDKKEDLKHLTHLSPRYVFIKIYCINLHMNILCISLAFLCVYVT